MALKGIRVIEMAGLAPGPMCGMILADFGADVIRVDKIKESGSDTMSRGKRSIALNLKNQSSVNVVHRLVDNADVLIEPFRAGVMEKLKLGPGELCERNKRLIYARLTGYGQSGPYANMAGHDINYIATSGILSMLGRENEKPHAPVNLLADFAGGGLSCALGIMLALFERTKSGRGQIIDASMVEGSAYVGSFLWLSRNINYVFNLWDKERGKNLLDGGAPFYDTYETKDGKYMAVGSLEPQFYDLLLQGLKLSNEDYPQFTKWKEMRMKFMEIFKTKTQAEWVKVFDGTDACVTPVVNLTEAHNHPHNANRDSFMSGHIGSIEPTPAPKLGRTPARTKSRARPNVGQHTMEILQELKLTQDEIRTLVDNNAIGVTGQSKL